MADEDAQLSRRELRERERSGDEANLTTDDLLAAELERQLAPFRSEDVLNSAEPEHVVDSVSIDDVSVDVQSGSAVTVPVPSEPVLMPADLEPAGPVKPHKPKTKSKTKRARKATLSASSVVPATLISTEKTGVPRRRSATKMGARVFSWIAIIFVAGIALASSIPAIALMTPEQLALQAELERIKYSGQIGDTQSLSVSNSATGTTARDGVSVALNGASAAGVYQAKKLSVSVPLATNPTIWPFPHVRTSSPYGYRASILGTSPFHTGLDFDLPYGTEIQSVADGIVTYIEDPGPMCGSSIMVDSNVNGTRFTTVYCHMIMKSTKLAVGQSVKAGDVVGQIGLTGITTGPHLHLEIRVNDVPVDPWAFLIQRAGNPPS